MPLAGTLALGQYTRYGLTGAFTTDVTFGNVAPVSGNLGLTTALPSDRTNTAWFDAPTLNGFGLGGFNINSASKITVNAPLQFAPGAQVKLTASDRRYRRRHHRALRQRHGHKHPQCRDEYGLVGRCGGRRDADAGSRRRPSTRAACGSMAQTGSTSLSGLGLLDGGNVTFDSTQNVTLAAGSVIDVSSGGAILANGKTQGGKGGNVTILAGHVQQDAAVG